jgi:hypothetical protein
MVRRWLLASVAALALGAAGAQTVPHGSFGSQAEIYRSPPGPVAQTLAPDNSALSIITEGLEIRGGGAASDALVLRVSGPLLPKQRATINVDIRGAPITEGGALCRTLLISGDGVKSYQPRHDDPVLAQWKVAIEASAKFMLFSLVVICDGMAGSFLYSIDALDLAWSYTESKQ